MSEQRYQHYSLRHRLVAWISQTAFDRVTYTVNHGILRGMRRRGGLGWLPEWITGRDESAEHRFFRELEQEMDGKVVYDVGAFIGLFAMICARRARTVVCYEPLLRNRERLEINLGLNNIRNVLVRPYGIGRAKATLEMQVDPLMPGGASLSANIGRGIAEGSRHSERFSVQITTLDDDIIDASLSPPDLIKIDIEGFELDALHGAAGTIRAHKPMLYLEMHGETLEEKRRNVVAILQFLEGAGYSDIRHIESRSVVTSTACDVAANGHLFCR